MAEGSAVQVCRALPNREVQSLDIRGVQLLRVFGNPPEFLPAPSGSHSCFPFHFDHTVSSAFLDHLTIQRRTPKDSLHNLPIELESIRGDQWNPGRSHSGENILEEEKRVAIGPLTNDSRGPQARPYLNGCENPDGGFFPAPNHCAYLVNLQFTNYDIGNCLSIEATTPSSGLLQPTIHCVPANTLHTGNGRLAHALNTHHSNRIKRRAPMLKPMIDRPEVRAECSATTFAPKSSPLAPPSLIKSKTNDLAGRGLGSREAIGIGTTEKFHGLGTRSSGDLLASKVGLKP